MTPLARLRACTDDSMRLGWTGATKRDLTAERAAADAEIARLREVAEVAATLLRCAPGTVKDILATKRLREALHVLEET